MSLVIIGADPGAQGAVTGLDAYTLEILFTVDMPMFNKELSVPHLNAELDDALAGHQIWLSAIELVGSMPGEGHRGAFRFGQTTGRLEGVLGTRGRVEKVTPATWKRHHKITEKGDAGKKAALAKAAQRWPEKASLFLRVRDDGRAESALIAEWATATFSPPPMDTTQLTLLLA